MLYPQQENITQELQFFVSTKTRLLVLLLLCFGCKAQDDEMAIYTMQPDIQEGGFSVVSSTSGRYEAFPTVVECGGELVTVFYSGNTHGGEGRPALKRSSDFGQTWDGFQYLDDNSNNWRTPCLLKLPNGDLIVYYWNRTDVHGTSMGSFIRSKISTDCGLTWENYVDLPPVWTLSNRNDKPLLTSSETILLPIAGYDLEENLNKQVAGVYRSTDLGLTFSFIPFPDQKGILTECSFLERDEVIYAYNRRNDNGTLLRAESRDDGITWSGWTDVTPSNYLNSRPDLFYDEFLFLAYRTDPQNRLAIGISEDLGETWEEYQQTIELPNTGTNRLLVYADFIRVNKSQLLLVFGWEKSNNVSEVLVFEVEF